MPVLCPQVCFQIHIKPCGQLSDRLPTFTAKVLLILFLKALFKVTGIGLAQAGKPGVPSTIYHGLLLICYLNTRTFIAVLLVIVPSKELSKHPSARETRHLVYLYCEASGGEEEAGGGKGREGKKKKRKRKEKGKGKKRRRRKKKKDEKEKEEEGWER